MLPPYEEEQDIAFVVSFDLACLSAPEGLSTLGGGY